MDVTREKKIKDWFKDIANLTIILFLAVLVILILQMILKSSSLIFPMLGGTVIILISGFFIFKTSKGIKLIGLQKDG